MNMSHTFGKAKTIFSYYSGRWKRGTKIERSSERKIDRNLREKVLYFNKLETSRNWNTLIEAFSALSLNYEFQNNLKL